VPPLTCDPYQFRFPVLKGVEEGFVNTLNDVRLSTTQVPWLWLTSVHLCSVVVPDL
jgi:hypothetical protein